MTKHNICLGFYSLLFFSLAATAADSGYLQEVRDTIANHPFGAILDKYRVLGTRVQPRQQSRALGDVVVDLAGPEGRSSSLHFVVFPEANAASQFAGKKGDNLLFHMLSDLTTVDQMIPYKTFGPNEQYRALMADLMGGEMDALSCIAVFIKAQGRVNSSCGIWRGGADNVIVYGEIGVDHVAEAQWPDAAQKLYGSVAALTAAQGPLLKKIMRIVPPGKPFVPYAPSTRSLGMKLAPLPAEGPRPDAPRPDAPLLGVVSVEPGGFAASLGVKRGDVVISVNGQPIRTVADLNRVQASLSSGSSVRIEVLRDIYAFEPEVTPLSGRIP